MVYKVLEKQDVELMKDFVDDVRTKYDTALLNAFLEEKNVYAYVAKEDDVIVGFAYGYVLVRPDGQRDFYLHAIDVMERYQKHGYGTELMKYIHAHSQSMGCRKLFLITNKSNESACRCYENAGGISKAADDIVYVFEEKKWLEAREDLMNKQNISVHDKSVFVGIWNYIKPSMKPDKDGNVMLVKMLCFGPCEWWEWSMDKEGKFWVEYKWCENDLYEAENFREECSQEKMIEKMQQMQNFFNDCGLDEYVEVYKKAEQFVRAQKRIAD